MTEVEEDQYMEESNSLAQQSSGGPFAKFTGTFDDSKKPSTRIQLIDKFTKSLENFEL